MPEAEEYDIVIVGAGPAGLSTALHLAKTAPKLLPRLVVLEKARHPRPKPCAGGLTADAEVILERLGLDSSEVPHAEARSLKFDFARHGIRLISFRKWMLRLIRRDEFDAWLAGKAREREIAIREGVTVLSVRVEDGGVIVNTDAGVFRARVLVGADGSNGIVRREVLPQAPLYTARALEVLTPPHTNSRRKNDSAYFELSPIPRGIAGYIWDFPTQVKGQPMRCWGIYDANLYPSEKRPPLKDLLAKEMGRFGLNLDAYDIQGHPIRWFDPSNPFSAAHVLLTGDAAGVDPMLGEGISVALGYGQVAARTIKAAFAKQDFRFRDYRGRILRSPLGQTLMVRWFITYIFYTLRWSWFQALVWWLLKPMVAFNAYIFILGWGKRMK